MDYMRAQVTKNRAQPLPSAGLGKQHEAQRKKLMDQIKTFDDDSDFEPDVKDIAKHIDKELDIGTREQKADRRKKGGQTRNNTESLNSMATEYKSGQYATQSDLHDLRLQAVCVKESPNKFSRDQEKKDRYL